MVKCAIFWASDPVFPNETVMLAGCGFSPDTVVEIKRLADCDTEESNAGGKADHWETVRPLQVSERCVKFVLPVSFSMGIFAVRVVCGGKRTEPVMLNAPDVWWKQGEGGETASPGGWLRIFGKCLDWTAEGSSPQTNVHCAVALCAADGRRIPLPARQTTCYNLWFDVPADIAAGQYSVSVHNGYGGETGWRDAGKMEIRLKESWPGEIFNVMDYYGDKAEAEMNRTWQIPHWLPPEERFGLDRTAAVQKALEQAAKNGGGVVFFPRGRYCLRGTLSVPPRTVLRGEDMNSVYIYWDKNEPIPDVGVSGADFAVEEITFYFRPDKLSNDGCGKIGIVVTKESRFFRMFHVRIRVIDYQLEWGIRFFKDDKLAPVGTGNTVGGTAVAVYGRNYVITDCDLHSSQEGLRLFEASYGLVANNKFWMTHRSFYLDGVNGLIAENNSFMALTTIAWTCSMTTYWSLASENVYFAHNRSQALFQDLGTNDWSLDFGPTAYFGKANCDGTKLTLAKDPTYAGFWKYENKTPPENWRRALVTIMEGTGAGQYRRVMHSQGRAWEIDRPWQVAPDETSVFSITVFQGNILFVGNLIEDGAWIAMGYNVTVNSIAVGNELRRCASLHSYGRKWPYDDGEGYPPCWFTQFLDNRIREGHTRLQVFGRTEHWEHKIKLEETLTRFHVLRRNVIDELNTGTKNVGRITVGPSAADVIVENCVTPDINIEICASGVVLAGNRWKDGQPKLSGPGLSDAFVHPAS